MKSHVETLRWEGASRGEPGFVRMIEQTLLPGQHVELSVRSVEEMVDAIYRLAIRGAPAIGIAAAYGVLLGMQTAQVEDGDDFLGRTGEVCATLAKARPTAVNLFWALERMQERARRDHARGATPDALLEGLFEEAFAIQREDAKQCQRMGELGAKFLRDGMVVLTHCNAGALATGGMGTALAPIYVAHGEGKKIAVYADETRPLLQGARLTAWELTQAGVEVTLITDNMTASVMQQGKIDAVFVGSDRIARNGDVCNKIGTYGVAVLARQHGIPFYVVAPLSTFDPQLASGAEIPIEERPGKEVTFGFGKRTAPEGVRVYNPAFDVTPAELVTAIVTEVGVIEGPTMERVEEALRRGGRI
ncbi:MAG: S-methyl-5-thioribose-1-phosphate isomerase [Planctomycetes bacterium]|nr:S-methyl-5-thioribose-1-phosphate isomerase [Planctomycetota bacterium]